MLLSTAAMGAGSEVSAKFQTPVLQQIQNGPSLNSSFSSSSGAMARPLPVRDVAGEMAKRLQDGVRAIAGSKATFDTKRGLVAVHGSRAMVDRVEQFVAAENRRASTQVTVEVRMLTFTARDATALKSAEDYLALAKPEDVTATPARVLAALQSLGRVAEDEKASLNTLDGIGAPMQVLNTRGYVSAVESDGREVRVHPGTVTTGFSLEVTPEVVSDDSVRMHVALSFSSLEGAQNGFDIFTSPSGKIVQLPNVTSHTWSQSALMPKGGTLVLSTLDSKPLALVVAMLSDNVVHTEPVQRADADTAAGQSL